MASMTKAGSSDTEPPSDHLTAAFIAVPEGRGNQRRGGVSNRRPIPDRASESSESQDGQEQPVSGSNQRTTTFFIRGCPPTKATGWRPVITATVSDRGYQRIGDLTKTDTGFGPTTAGTGTQTSVLAGQPTTTADGSILAGPDGAGFPEINGLQLGSPGGKVTKTLAGLPFHPKQTSPRINRSRLGPTRIMTLDRLLTLLSAIPIGANRAIRTVHRATSNETFRSSSETRNVTNIVTNNNVINNFGPPVQTIARRTNQKIPQVQLALNPATDPKSELRSNPAGQPTQCDGTADYPQVASSTRAAGAKSDSQILRSKKDGKA